MCILLLSRMLTLNLDTITVKYLQCFIKVLYLIYVHTYIHAYIYVHTCM